MSAAAARRRRLLDTYRFMWMARRIDVMERELVARGEASFQVSGAGHEASAALAPQLESSDFVHAHYRDKALLLALGLPPRECFDSLLGNAQSHSGGRQMSAHFSAPKLGVLSIVGPVGNHALQAVGVAQELRDRKREGIVVCSMGDGTTQQGEVMEAIAEAVRGQLPVLFLVHDNRYAISTPTTGRTFFSLPDGPADRFHGCPIHRVDGMRPDACDSAFADLAKTLRRGGGPLICVMAVERLCDHTNADDERTYRGEAERQRARIGADPLFNGRKALRRLGVPDEDLQRLEASAEDEVRCAARASVQSPRARPMPDAPPQRPAGLPLPAMPTTMAQALRDTLRLHLQTDPRVSLYGQDIEDPKGDVFGLTRGLSTAFPGRVRNAPLSESTIVGTAVGRALAGGRPVAFVQFADFLPLALNQLMSELATLDWRTRGAWRAPVVVMATCGAYRPGLGPFHAQTLDSLLAHVPGLDVMMPATPADAAVMLSAALCGERPCVLLVPKALLHATAEAPAAAPAPYGAWLRCRGSDLTMVSWGNTTSLCERAAESLAQAGVATDLIDLRWLAPWDHEAVLRSVRRTGRLLVVHEDNLTGGFGAEVVARVAERLPGTACRRVARRDEPIPCHTALQAAVLPSYRAVLEAASALVDLQVGWLHAAAAQDGRQVVPIICASPTDRTAQVVELHVRPGQFVAAGAPLAIVEAEKAVFEIASPAAGVVETVHLREGDRADVGTPLLTLAVTGGSHNPVQEPTATLQRNSTRAQEGRPPAGPVVIQAVAAAPGSGRIDNDELAHLLGLDRQHGAASLLRSTGIASRHAALDNEDAVSLACVAARRALDQAGLQPNQIDAVVCSSSTPLYTTPSLACLVMNRLAPDHDAPAVDLQAACSGYLYALAWGWDLLQQQPQARVLVLTTETMRRIVDPRDAATSPIFGDAATATLLSRDDREGACLARLHRPQLGARGDDGSSLRVPARGPVHMDGRAVFPLAVRGLCQAMVQACKASGLAVRDLDLVVPHQANGRIIEAVGSRLGLPASKLCNDIRLHGNTSSSSIPLALARVLPAAQAHRIGICAFGAGYTYGAAVLECG